MLQREGEFKGEHDVRIWYQAWAPQAPKAILAMVHGLGEHSGRHGNLVDLLLPRGYVLYAHDQRGHGRSSGPQGHIDRFSDLTADVGRLLEQARIEHPDLPLFLFGHSLGGLIALRYALEHPRELDGVIASAPGLRRNFAVPWIKLFLGTVMSGVWPEFAQHSGLPAPLLSHDPQVAAAYLADPLVHDWASARLFTEVTRAGRDTLADAPGLAMPCLIMQGSADGLVDPEATREFYERAGAADKTLHVYDGFYHESLNEVERARPLADLAAWLDAHLPVEG